MPDPIPAERLTEARRAMEGELWRKKRETEAQIIIKRREEARRAMEGRERQLKRQTKEGQARKVKEQEIAAVDAAAAEITRARQLAQSAVEAERRKAMQTAAGVAAQRRQTEATMVKIEKMKTATNEMSAIRTFKTDLAAAATSGASITQAIIRDQNQPSRRRSDSNQEPHSDRWLLLILILLLLGGGALGYVYWVKSMPQAPAEFGAPPATSTSNGLVKPLFIFTDKQVEIEMGGLTRGDFILKLRQAMNDGALVLGQITSIVPTRAKPLAFNAWLTELQITSMEKITPTFEPKFLLGRYDGSEQAATFLILETNKYDAAFAALRQNELGLVSLFYLLTGRTIFSTPTTTAKFTDRLSNNLEIRELVSNEQVFFLYVFLDQNILVLTENEAVLAEILTRRDINALSN